MGKATPHADGRIRRGELGLLLILGSLLFANSFALEIAEAVSISGFLSEVDTYNVIIVWIVDMILIMITSSLQSLIVDRYNRIRLMTGMIAFIMFAYIGLRLLFLAGAPDVMNYSILFVLGDQQWIFFPLIFWVLANDIFDVSQGIRLFPLLVTISFFGQLGGSFLAASAPALFDQLNITQPDLLTLNAIIFGVLLFVVIFGLRNIKLKDTRQESESVKEVLSEGWEFVKAVPSFRYLIITYIGLAIALQVVRYHFFVVTDASISTAEDFQTFYGAYRMVLLLANIAVSTYLTSRLVERVGLKNAFLFSPVIMFCLGFLILASPELLFSTIAMIGTWLMFYAIDQPARKSFQGLVPEERRGRVSMFMDSYILAFGALLGSIAIGLVVLTGEIYNIPNYWVTYVLVGILGAIVAFWAALQARKHYDASMLNWRMKRRTRRSSVLDKLDF